MDNAESEPEKAFEVNAQVPRMLGDIVLKKSIRLIHISTDYVFGGEIPIPYTETSPTNPLSVYGKSKLKGELALRNNPNVMILRSAWLFSEFGNNFLKSIYRLGKERADINVVFDQVGSPTYANDLARCIFLIMEYAENKEFLPGIYHYTNEGICSWFDLAWEIIHKTALKCRIHPVTSDEYPLPAKRPSYSVLNKSRIKKVFGLEIPHWKKSLEIAIDRMTKI